MSFGGFYRGRRVLVTGHTGFKGSWLSHWLLQLGAEVHGLALAPVTSPALFEVLGLAPRMHHRLLDVRDAAGVALAVQAIAPEVVLHLAAQPLVRASYRSARETWETNVLGTVHLLEAMRTTASVRACVVITSDKCYANHEDGRAYRESDALGGADPYSASKAAAEIAVASYRQSFFGTGARLATARAGNVIGGGDWADERLVTDFLATIAAGRPLALRNPHAVRPWQHVLEPLAGYLALAARLAGPSGDSVAGAWNFGPADEGMITVHRLATLLTEQWGEGELHDGSQPDQLHEAGMLRLDCRKARAELPWHGVWSVEEAVARTVAWYRLHRAGGEMHDFTDQQLAAYTDAAAQRGLPWAT